MSVKIICPTYSFYEFRPSFFYECLQKKWMFTKSCSLSISAVIFKICPSCSFIHPGTAPWPVLSVSLCYHFPSSPIRSHSAPYPSEDRVKLIWQWRTFSPSFYKTFIDTRPETTKSRHTFTWVMIWYIWPPILHYKVLIRNSRKEQYQCLWYMGINAFPYNE